MSLYFDNVCQRLWRPVSIADANRRSVPWARRNEARDRLDELSFAHELSAASCALGRKAGAPDVKTAPQRAPLHTDYPAFPAARACLGLSAIAEFRAHAGSASPSLQATVKELEPLTAHLDAEAVSQTAAHVVEAVTSRLCVDHLYRFEGLAAVESYRLFAAAILDLRFTRLKDVILGACTLGDLVYSLLNHERMRRRLHELTYRILRAVAPPVRRYELATAECPADALPALGAALAADLMRALLPFLPLKRPPEPAEPKPPAGVPADMWAELVAQRVPLRRPSAAPVPEDVLSTPLAGADQPLPPSIDAAGGWRLLPDGAPDGSGRLPAPPGAPSPADQALQALQRRASKALADATGGNRWDDPRVDQVAKVLRDEPFKPSILEAELAAHRRRVKAFGSDREGGVREEALPRCRNEQTLRRIRQGAAPVEKKLAGYQWFGHRREMRVRRSQARGELDPRRLARLAVSPLICRQWRKCSATDYRGRPVVVLAKDGSSSNTFQTTFAGQILTMAFLRVERIARIRLYAADYSSDPSAPLVRWLYHPQKTPGRGSFEAADAVASLPPKGQGGNEDVLSVSHILHEVLDLPGMATQKIIVINITDGKFNSPLDQVRSMVARLRADYPLTYSFVVLGNTAINVPEADHTVSIPDGELKDPHLIAERIARHVNWLVRDLRGKAGRRHD